MTIFADKERSMMQARRDFKADRPAGYLDRTDFLVLAGLEIPAYYSLRRRGQLPLMPAAPGSPSALLMEAGYPTPDEMPPDWDARGWDPGAALAVIVSTQFVD